MDAKLFLGLDGGASKTQGVILDENGRLRAESRAGGSAIIGKPNPAACAVLSTLIDELLKEAGATRERISHCAIGLNGIDYPSEYAMQIADISRAVEFPEQRLTLVNDGLVALWGATGEPRAAVIQCGSGFTSAFRRRHGAEELFDSLNAGHIVDLRWGLVHLVARMIDGRAEPTPLKDLLLNYLGIASEADFANAIFSKAVSPARVRSTVPLVAQAWQAGDPGARDLVNRWMDDLALTAKAMVRRIGDGRAMVALGGGVLTRVSDEMLAVLAQRIVGLCPQASVCRSQLSPVLGAAFMAAFKAGENAQALFDVVARTLSPAGERAFR